MREKEKIDQGKPVSEESAVELDLQKAIRLIHPDTTKDEIWKHKDYGNKDKMIAVIEKACEMVCDAAGRQIAREVKEFEWYEEEQYVVWVCPVCGTSHTSGYEANYCPECGQGLEWKHEKDKKEVKDFNYE